MKTTVFWFTVPMLIFSVSFMLIIICYAFTRITKFRKASWLTQVQFILLFIFLILEISQLALYNMT